MRLWIDDIRQMPADYDFWARNFNQASSALLSGEVTHVSFDHDLGDESVNGNGYLVACLVEELAYKHIINPVTWEIHSANPVGAKRIKQAMESAEVYWCVREGFV